MNDAPTLQAFLDRAGAVVRLGPRDHLAIERLMRSRGSWAPDELRAALASVLARSPDQWQRIATIYDEVVEEAATAARDVVTAGDADSAEAGTSRVSLKGTRERRAPRLSDRLVSGSHRVGELLRNAPRGLWATAIGLAVVVPLVVVLAWLLPSPPEAHDPLPVESAGSAVASAEEGGVVLIPVDLDRDLEPKVFAQPPALPLSTWLGVALLSALAVAFGLSWFRLPAAYREQHEAELRAQEVRAEGRRHKLQKRKAEEGRALGVRYHVDLHLPVSRQAVLDSAEHLGRIFGESPGSDLDAEATLDRTLAAGGRFEPVLETRLLRHDVVLLIDFEEGNHPWLDAFLRLVEAWRAQGIVFRSHRFHVAPDQVVDLETQRPVHLGDLARQTEDLPLIVFSRQLDPAARDRVAEWLGVLDAWPRRVWLDPDPRPRDERDRYRKAAIWKLERRGLDRFHLTDSEVVAMARHLAGSDEGRRPVASDPPLVPSPRPGAEETEVGEALRLWALVAALVPDPTWDQLEAIRRHFPEIEGPLPEARYLQRLLEWTEARTGQSPELDGGRGLAIPPQQQDVWLREQRRRERDRTSGPILDRAHGLLLKQLESTRPKDEADFEMWRFKRSMHKAMLEPHRAAEFLRWIGESSIRHEALRWLKAELARRDEGAGEPLPVRDREVLASLTKEKDVPLPLRALATAPGSTRWRVSWAPAVIGGLLVALLLTPWLRPETNDAFAKQVSSVVVERPVVYEVNERSHLPVMVEMPARSFMMGGRDYADEQPVHRVEIAAFEMAKTEVTVSQYRACVDADACEEPGAGNPCNWGVEGREDHPINCVSWEDAKRYAAWIGARLPSEAEWEYAARSEGLGREYPWGDEAVTCDRAVISEERFGTGCDGQARTQEVCARPAGNTDQGLCDMAGNVYEWVEDDWHGSYNNAPEDGSAWTDDPRASYRVFRGGSWWNAPAEARVAHRVAGGPIYRDGYLGFRVARSLPSTL